MHPCFHIAACGVLVTDLDRENITCDWPKFVPKQALPCMQHTHTTSNDVLTCHREDAEQAKQQFESSEELNRVFDVQRQPTVEKKEQPQKQQAEIGRGSLRTVEMCRQCQGVATKVSWLLFLNLICSRIMIQVKATEANLTRQEEVRSKNETMEW